MLPRSWRNAWITSESHGEVSQRAADLPLLALFSSETHIVLSPASVSDNRQALVVRREDAGVFEMRLEVDASALVGGAASRTVYGCAGAVRLLAGYYLVVLKSCALTGTVRGAPVYKATSFDIVPCAAPALIASLSSRQLAKENRYLRLLRASLAHHTKHLFFSPGHDLTRSVQSAAVGSAAGWAFADPRFCWNRHPGDTLVSIVGSGDVSPFVTPFVCGSFGVATAQTDVGYTARVTLVARTSVCRVGIRHHCRGSDSKGEVANHVETEQIVEIEGSEPLSSFVVVRGSVPLRWSQPLQDLYWRFRLWVRKPIDDTPLRAHFEALMARHSRVTVIDLLRAKGSEATLRDAFARTVVRCTTAKVSDADSDVRYLAFDYHRESAGGHAAAISKLTKITETDAERYGYHVDRSGKCQATQRGVFRVNCKDCLDRTNLVQAALAERALRAQLRRLRGDSTNPVATDVDGAEEALMAAHRRLWMEHGDKVSAQYSRTPALRREVTRSGRRTFLGALQDGRTALMRYYSSKFTDRRAQDSLRLWTRGLAASAEQLSPLARRKQDWCLNQPQLVDEDDWEAEQGRRNAGNGSNKVAPESAPAGEHV